MIISEKDKESQVGTVTDEGTKTYQVKLDLGLSRERVEYLVDKMIMPFLFPNNYPRR